MNGDGSVNILDLVAVAAAIGKTDENDADVNGDGTVNVLDLVAVAAAFGEVAAAPFVYPSTNRGADNLCGRAAVAHTGRSIKSHGSQIAAGYSLSPAAIGCIDTERDSVVSELSEPV